MKAKYLLLDPSRWIKRAEKSNRGDVDCYCLIGAVRAAYPEAGAFNAAWAKVKSATKKLFGYDNPVSFNDAEKTNFDQIREILKEADV